MKAQFKSKGVQAGRQLPLTIMKMYYVLDIKMERRGKKGRKITEIKVKNDSGEEMWYDANNFILFAEAAAYLKEPAAAGAGQDAAQSATPDGSQIYAGIDLAKGADMTAGFTAREMVEVGKEIARGLAAGIGLHYGA